MDEIDLLIAHLEKINRQLIVAYSRQVKAKKLILAMENRVIELEGLLSKKQREIAEKARRGE